MTTPSLPDLRRTLSLALVVHEREQIIDFNGHFGARPPAALGVEAMLILRSLAPAAKVGP